MMSQRFWAGELQAEGEPERLLKVGAALEVVPRDRYLTEGWRLEVRYGGGGGVEMGGSGG